MLLSSTQQSELLCLARDAIRSRLEGFTPALPTDPAFLNKKGVFVSLHIQGELRGCIGYIIGHKSIRDSVLEMAQAAAFQDPRFPAVTLQDLELLDIEISILDDLIPIQNAADIKIGRDGLYIQHPHGSGLLLPQVAVEWRWDADEFLHQVCRKAGLPKHALQDGTARLFRFEALIFS